MPEVVIRKVEIMDPFAAALVGPEFQNGVWRCDFNDPRIVEVARTLKMFAPPGYSVLFNAGQYRGRLPDLGAYAARMKGDTEFRTLAEEKSPVYAYDDGRLHIVNVSNRRLPVFNFDSMTGQQLRLGGHFYENMQGLVNADDLTAVALGLSLNGAYSLFNDLMAQAIPVAERDDLVVRITRELSVRTIEKGYDRWMTAKEIAMELPERMGIRDGHPVAGVMSMLACRLFKVNINVNDYTLRRFDPEVERKITWMQRLRIKFGLEDSPVEGHNLDSCIGCRVAPNCTHLGDFLNRNPEYNAQYSSDYTIAYFKAFYKFLQDQLITFAVI